MKINHSETSVTPAQPGAPAAAAASTKKAHGKPVSGAHPARPAHGAPGGASGAEGSVKVDVSAKARELAAKPEVDAAKVEALKAAIDGGTFKVDPKKIATALVAKESA